MSPPEGEPSAEPLINDDRVVEINDRRRRIAAIDPEDRQAAQTLEGAPGPDGDPMTLEEAAAQAKRMREEGEAAFRKLNEVVAELTGNEALNKGNEVVEQASTIAKELDKIKKGEGGPSEEEDSTQSAEVVVGALGTMTREQYAAFKDLLSKIDKAGTFDEKVAIAKSGASIFGDAAALVAGIIGAPFIMEINLLAWIPADWKQFILKMTLGEIYLVAVEKQCEAGGRQKGEAGAATPPVVPIMMEMVKHILKKAAIEMSKVAAAEAHKLVSEQLEPIGKKLELAA